MVQEVCSGLFVRYITFLSGHFAEKSKRPLKEAFLRVFSSILPDILRDLLL